MAKTYEQIRSVGTFIKNTTTAKSVTNQMVGENIEDIADKMELDKSFKGYFSTLSSLISSYPSPEVGDTAWVGATYPGTVYDVISGAWHDTTIIPSTGSIDLGEYVDKKTLKLKESAIIMACNNTKNIIGWEEYKGDFENGCHLLIDGSLNYDISDYKTTNFIGANNLENIYLNIKTMNYSNSDILANICYYDENKKFVSSFSLTNNFTVMVNYRFFIRISVKTDNYSIKISSTVENIKINDKRIVFMGDSITANTENGGLPINRQYVKYLEYYMGLTNYVNYAVGGNVWSTWINSSFDINNFASPGIHQGNTMMASLYLLKKRIDDGIEKIPDFIICNCGTNDLSKSIIDGLNRNDEEALGNPDLVFNSELNTNDDPRLHNTLSSSIRFFCETIQKLYPTTKIISISPIQRSDNEGDIYRIQKTCNIMQKCFNYLGIEFIRMDEKCNIYRWNAINNGLLSSDGVHPTDKGAQLMAEKLFVFLNSIKYFDI